jgi:hypothetical protein
MSRLRLRERKNSRTALPHYGTSGGAIERKESATRRWRQEGTTTHGGTGCCFCFAWAAGRVQCSAGYEIGEFGRRGAKLVAGNNESQVRVTPTPWRDPIVQSDKVPVWLP